MSYVPNRGDVVWFTFTPQAGHEQAGRRPAVVVSPRASQAKGYPFEVVLPAGVKLGGVVLADQVKKPRLARAEGRVPRALANEDAPRGHPEAVDADRRRIAAT